HRLDADLRGDERETGAVVAGARGDDARRAARPEPPRRGERAAHLEAACDLQAFEREPHAHVAGLVRPPIERPGAEQRDAREEVRAARDRAGPREVVLGGKEIEARLLARAHQPARSQRSGRRYVVIMRSAGTSWPMPGTRRTFTGTWFFFSV